MLYRLLTLSSKFVFSDLGQKGWIEKYILNKKKLYMKYNSYIFTWKDLSNVLF